MLALYHPQQYGPSAMVPALWSQRYGPSAMVSALLSLNSFAY